MNKTPSRWQLTTRKAAVPADYEAPSRKNRSQESSTERAVVRKPEQATKPSTHGAHNRRRRRRCRHRRARPSARSTVAPSSAIRGSRAFGSGSSAWCFDAGALRRRRRQPDRAHLAQRVAVNFGSRTPGSLQSGCCGCELRVCGWFCCLFCFPHHRSFRADFLRQV